MQISALEELNREREAEKIRKELDRLGLQGYELDPNAHIDLEVLQRLETARVVGDPRTWMGNNLNNTEPIPDEEVHPEQLRAIRRIARINGTDPKQNLAVMTELANSKDPNYTEPSDNPESRKTYQDSEWDIMNMAITAYEDLIMEIPSEETALWIVLRGAKFFQSDFEIFAKTVIENESKRIKLKGGEFAVGHNMVTELEGIERSNIRQIIIPDDCLSTAMTQEENIRMIFDLGFRPERIVIPIDVATTDGFKKLKALEALIQEQYKAEFPQGFEILIIPPTRCDVVDEEMYLGTLDGRALVGDMGNWNRPAIRQPEKEESTETAEQ
jgi:hypothetical protein